MLFHPCSHPAAYRPSSSSSPPPAAETCVVRVAVKTAPMDWTPAAILSAVLAVSELRGKFEARPRNFQHQDAVQEEDTVCLLLYHARPCCSTTRPRWACSSMGLTMLSVHGFGCFLLHLCPRCCAVVASS